MRELEATIAAWRAEGQSIGRAVVVRTFGSAPRPEGAVLLVAGDGRIAGSVSGGCVEGAAFEEVERARRTGRSRVIRYGISDEQAWDVGLACGGTIDVLIQPEVPEAALRAAADRDGVAVVTPLPAGSPGPDPGPHKPGEGSPPMPPLRVSAAGDLEGTLGDPVPDAALVTAAQDALATGDSRVVELGGASYFIEAFPAPLRLVIVGAVQVAMPLVRIAHEVGYRTVVIDGREVFATRERFPDADALIVGWPDEIADDIGLGPDDAVAVLTHDVKFDEPAIVAALERGCRYVGAVGSRRTQADRRARLVVAGVSPEALDRLRGPIGLDLGGRAPAETALAIMAEVVAARHGASGGPLKAKAVAGMAGTAAAGGATGAEAPGAPGA